MGYNGAGSNSDIIKTIRLPLLIVSLAVGVTIIIVAYFYFMPYWIVIEKRDSQYDGAVVESDRIFITISDKQLDELPMLRQAIEQANTANTEGIISVKVSDLSEANKLMDLLKGWRLYYTAGNDLTLRYGINEYDIYLVHGYDKPQIKGN